MAAFQPIDLNAQQVQKDQQVQLLQQMQLQTQGMQAQQVQAQQTQQRAAQFLQQMTQIPAGANWADKISAAAQSAIKTGDFNDADKIIGVWSKAAEQQDKAAKEGASAAEQLVKTRAEKGAAVAQALSGVTSQSDLDYRRSIYKEQRGEDLPPELQTFRPGMDKTIESMNTTALQKADILLKEAQAKADKQRADAETMKAKAQAYKDSEEAKTQESVRIKNAKEGGKYEAEAEKARASAANGGGGSGANADRYGYTQNVINAGINATVDLDNLSKLPEGSGISWMSGMQDKTGPALTDALRANFARSLTPADRQTYKAAAAGLSNALSSMQTNGRNATAGMRHANQEATDINENDKADAAAYKLARVRQEIDVANESMQVNPKATPEQKKKFQEVADKAAKAVPFTTDDAVKAMSPAKARTMAQAFNEKISKARGEVTSDGIPKSNAKGWTLHTDDQGNKAYVSPDGKNYEEVQ